MYRDITFHIQALNGYSQLRTRTKYALTYIINHLHVSVASATIIRVLYRNTDKI